MSGTDGFSGAERMGASGPGEPLSWPDAHPVRCERLEPRLLLSCTAVHEGELLTILGTPGADAINVTDNGNGVILVSRPADDAGRGRSEALNAKYEGVRRIFIDAMGGDDDVAYSLAGPGGEVGFSPARLDVDLGKGDLFFRSCPFRADVGIQFPGCEDACENMVCKIG